VVWNDEDLLAALPAVVRAARIDPAIMLHAE
jgi:hypothetical protein